MMTKIVGEDRYLASGTNIRRDTYWNDDDQTIPQFGVIFHCWLAGEFDAYDCCIAFLGREVPVGNAISDHGM